MANKRLDYIRPASLEMEKICTAYFSERSGHNEDRMRALAWAFGARRDQLQRHGRVPGEISRGRLRAFPVELSDGLLWVIFIPDAQRYWALRMVRCRNSKLKRSGALVPSDADWRIAEDRVGRLA